MALRVKDLGHRSSIVTDNLDNFWFNILFVLSTFPILRVTRIDTSNN